MCTTVFSRKFTDRAPDKFMPSFMVSFSLVWLLPSPGDADKMCMILQSDRSRWSLDF